MSEFNKERKIALLLVICKLPNFVLAFAAGLASSSVIVWMEVIESASIIVPGALLAILSKKLDRNLKYRFNYGTGKVEAITAMACEIFDIAGLCCIFVLAITQLFGGGAEGEYILLSIILSVVGAIIDVFILIWQRRLMKEGHSKMLHTAYVSAAKEMVYDCIAIAALVLTYIFREQVWVRYISPVLCIIMAVPFFIIVNRHLGESVKELVDLTMDEESQFKVLKVLTRHSEEYAGIGQVRSRRSGQIIYFDIELTFRPEETYEDIMDTVRKVSNEIKQEIEHCSVNIVLYGAPEIQA